MNPFIRKLFLAFVFLVVTLLAMAQKTTLKTGVWSDAAVWNNHATPATYDSVALLHDVIVDVNASCRVLNTNGHQVHVNTGINFTVGNTVNSVDTATLLVVKTVEYDEFAVALDSTTITIRNNYLNGHKRIMETAISTYDTSYTLFEYDAQNRLAFITYYTNDPFTGVLMEKLTWTNNRLTKSESGWDGDIEYITNLTYVPNGTNTDIHSAFTRIPDQDTIYGNPGQVVYYKAHKQTISMDANFRILSKTFYLHSFNTSFGPGNAWDTSRTIYAYDAIGNLYNEVEYRNVSDTNMYNTSIHRIRDTTIHDYTRPLAENAALYEILRTVFGDEPLALIHEGQLEFTVADVLPTWYTAGYHPYQKQTINQLHIKSVSWVNGIRDSNGNRDDVPYKANQILDAQHRLKENATYDYYQAYIKYISTYMYP